MLSATQFGKAGKIFADNVELEVDNRSHLDGLEVGVLHGERDDCHAEGIALAVAHGQAHTVDSDRALFNRHISLGNHGRVGCIFKFEVAAAVGILDGGATGCGVDVALHNVAVQTPVHEH